MRISESEQNCTTPKSRNSESEQNTGENYNSTSRRNSKNIEKRKSVLKDNIEDAETMILSESKNGFEAKSDEKVTTESKVGPKKPKSDIKITESKIDKKESKSTPVTEPNVDPKEANSDTKIEHQKEPEPQVTKNEPEKLGDKNTTSEKTTIIDEIMTNPDQALAKSDSGFSEKVQDDDEVDDAPLVKKEELSLEKSGHNATKTNLEELKSELDLEKQNHKTVDGELKKEREGHHSTKGDLENEREKHNAAKRDLEYAQLPFWKKIGADMIYTK